MDVRKAMLRNEESLSKYATRDEDAIRFFILISSKMYSPGCPNGTCPMSCPSAIASIKSSFKANARPIVRAIFATN